MQNGLVCTMFVCNLFMGHSMSDHLMLETVPPQILIKIYTFCLCD